MSFYTYATPPSTEAMKIRFEGQTHQIEANTLINSLLHFTNIVQEVNRQLDPDKKVEIKINATQPGSFIIDLAILAGNTAQTLYHTVDKEMLTYAANLVKTVSGIYSVASFLKGNKPKAVTPVDNSVKIENNNGDVRIFNLQGANIYLNNPMVQEAAAQQFQTLENDPNVLGFDMLDKDNNAMVAIDRKDFSEIANNEGDETLAHNERVITKPNQVLRILAMSWGLNKKWQFLYQDSVISAKIKDTAFATLIDNGERFGKGDSLNVDLEIRQQEISISSGMFVNKSYVITRINKHIEHPQQSELDFPKK